MKRLSVLAFSLLPLLALAAEAAPGPFDGLLGKLLSPEVLAAGALGVLGLVLGGNAVRKRRVAKAVYHAFHIVEDAAAETEGEDALDKVAAGLKAADDWMKANGWRPLKPGEQEVAKLDFTAMNGAAKQAVKVQAQALEEAAAKVAPGFPTPPAQ